MSEPLRQSRGLRAREKPVQGMPTLEGLVVAVKGRACHEFAQNASPFCIPTQDGPEVVTSDVLSRLVTSHAVVSKHFTQESRRHKQ